MVIRRNRADREARLSEDALHVFEWWPIALALREEPEYAANGRNGITLVKQRDLRLVLEVLREGVGLAEHHEPGPVVVQVLEGELRVEAGEEAIYLPRGEILAMPGDRPHSVEALQDSTFLLTIAPQNELGWPPLSVEHAS